MQDKLKESSSFEYSFYTLFSLIARHTYDIIETKWGIIVYELNI